jgi:hypothetical protein
MKSRFLQFLIFLILVGILDRGIGWILQKKYRQCQKGNIGHTNQVMLSIEPELLIIGSSRASHHYVSSILEEELQLSCFNAGADGSEMDYHSAVYFANVARYQPEIVIIDINEFRFTKEGSRDGKLRILAPYLGINNRVDQLFYASDRWARFKTLSAIYPYNSELTNLMTGGGITIRDKGYDPLKGSMSRSAIPGTETRMRNASTNGARIQQLEELLADAQNKKIMMVLIQSPRYTNAVPNETIRQIAVLATKYGAYFVDDINHPDISRNPEYFKDAAHLNHAGAEAYSRIVAGYLRTWVKASEKTPSQDMTESTNKDSLQ